MKKLIIVFFITFFIFSNVNALELENSEIRYKWYKEEYKYMGLDEKINDINYYQDLDNYSIKYSNYKKYNNDNILGYYEIKDMYELYKAKKIEYIMISYKIIDNYNISISEISIKDNESNNIDYTVYDSLNVNKSSLDYLNDNEINTSNKTIMLSGGYLVLKLDKAYDINNINMDLYINSKYESSNKKIIFYFCPTSIRSYKTYSTKEFDLTNIVNNDDNDEHIKIKVDESWINTFEYDFINYSEEKDEENISITSYYDVKPYYRTYKIYYPTYKINKKYLDGYYTDLNLEGYIKDEKDYIIYYKNNNSTTSSNNFINQNTNKEAESIDKILNGTISNNLIKNPLLNKISNTDNNLNEKIKPIKIPTSTNSNEDNTINEQDTNIKTNTIYKYIPKYKVKYKYINTFTIISILLNIIFLIFLIYKFIKKKT